MYISYGWPKVLAALEPGSTQEEVVYIATDEDYFVLVSTSRIQVWTGGQHRVKLGTFTREQESIRTDGLNRRAFWSSSKRNLAVLVRVPQVSKRGFLCHISASYASFVLRCIHNPSKCHPCLLRAEQIAPYSSLSHKRLAGTKSSA